MNSSQPPIRPSVSRVLLRALRERCPACGHGRVFHHGFRSEKRCDTCGWWLERGPGHWIGGSEINMVVTYWTACLTFLGLSLAFGFSWVTLVLAGAFVIGFSLLIHRKSRCLFFALDYLIDPRHDPSSGPDGRPGGGDDPGPGGDAAPPIPGPSAPQESASERPHRSSRG